MEGWGLLEAHQRLLSRSHFQHLGPAHLRRRLFGGQVLMIPISLLTFLIALAAFLCIVRLGISGPQIYMPVRYIS